MTTLRPRTLRKEDFPGLLKAEPRAEELLVALNQMQRQLETILNGGIGHDNLNAQVATLDIPAVETDTGSPSTLASPFPLRIASKVSGRPVGVRLLRCVKTTAKKEEAVGSPVSVDWSLDADPTTGALCVVIQGLPGTLATDSYRAVLEIVGA